VTVSTGEASLIADLAPRTGIDLPDVPEPARARLLADLPTLGYVGNPLDPWGATDAATAYEAAFSAFAASGAYDVLALVHDFPYRSLPSEVETALGVLKPLLHATADREDLLPVFVSLTSGDPTPEIVDELKAGGGVPILRGTVEAFGAIAAVARWEALRERRLARGPRRVDWPRLATERTFVGHDARAALASTPITRTLAERESLDRLAGVGISVVRPVAVATVEDAVAAAGALGGQVVVKIDAEGLAHKSDIGGVRAGLHDPDAVRAAARELLQLPVPAGARRRGLLVAPHLDGPELIVGGRRDASFGPIVLVGLGGVLAEAIDDVAVRLAPIDPDEAAEMLDELRGRKILDGIRGRPGIDRAAVTATIVALGRALVDDPSLIEVDLNPLISGPATTAAVDALVVEAIS
jgi:acyl-CoA synthetase (NDP forming)